MKSVALCSVLVALSTSKPIEVARDLFVQNEVSVSGSIQTNQLQVNGTLSGTSIVTSATLEATTVRTDIIYTDVLSAKSGDTILVEGNLEMVGPKTTSASPVKPLSFLATSVVVDGIRQWSMVSSENFDDQNKGKWSMRNNQKKSLTTTTCGYPKDFFLGGACSLSSGIVTKAFTDLPMHKEIRMKATMNFIDQWRGEQVWIKLDGSYVWLDTIGQASDGTSVVAARQLSDSGMKSVCGNEQYMEIALGKLVDVTKSHNNDELIIEFGTSLKENVDSCKQSWGVDDVQLYIR